MEHVPDPEYPQRCKNCLAWIPKGDCPGRPRQVQVPPSEFPHEEAQAQTRYERQFGWD